jgi:fatty-acyl-CoA synthase
LRLGLKPGDGIGIWSRNCAEWVLTQFASAKAGLVLVNINPAYQRGELVYALNKVSCKVLIVASSVKGKDYIATMRDVAPELRLTGSRELECRALPHLKRVIRLGDGLTPGMLNFDDLLELGMQERVTA